MNPESNEEMRKEYELLPGRGVRGKYYERYTQRATVRLVFSDGPSFVANISSSAPSIGVITKPRSYPFSTESRNTNPTRSTSKASFDLVHEG